MTSNCCFEMDQFYKMIQVNTFMRKHKYIRRLCLLGLEAWMCKKMKMTNQILLCTSMILESVLTTVI